MYKLSRRSLSRLQGVRSVLIAIAVDAIKESPYDFGIPQYGGLRSAEDQRELYDKGVSKCDGVKNKSYHQSGNAFDIFVIINGKATWEKKYYEPIAKLFKNIAKDKYGIDLLWGGDFVTFEDVPHFEIRN